MTKTQSVEPNIADLANGWLKSYKLNYKLEQESLNTEIDQALNDYYSKNGGVGGNRPDAKLLLQMCIRDSPKTCPNCGGSGQVRINQRTPFGVVQSTSTCDRCHGLSLIHI